MNEINKNSIHSESFSEESFISLLHEKNIWSDEKYLKLEDDLYKNVGDFSKETILKATHIYSYLLFVIGCHLDSHDRFLIKNLSLTELYEKRERVRIVFESFFTGTMPDKTLLDKKE